MKVLIAFHHPAPYKVKLFNELAKTIDLDVIFEINKAKNRTDSFYKFNQYNFKVIPVKLHRFPSKKFPRKDENIYGGALARYIRKHHKEYDHIIMNGYRQFAELNAIKYLHKKKMPYVLYINGGIIKTKECKFIQNYKTKYISGASYYLSPDKESNKYLVYYGANSEKIFNYPYATIHESEILSKKISLTGSDAAFSFL